MGVTTYWGELATEPTIEWARQAGVAGLAGDLCVDGAIGSHTASLREPYADAETCGARYLSEQQIADHVIACTRAGLQAGFHCIGDDAVAAAVTGLRRAAAVARRTGDARGAASPGASGDDLRCRHGNLGRAWRCRQHAACLRCRLGTAGGALRATSRS